MSQSSHQQQLESMTWEEAGEAFESADFVVLPCGSTEQHSRHLPLAVDSIRASELTKRLVTEAERRGLELLVLPTLQYGYSEHHMHYPGTITLSSSTYIDVIVDIGTSILRHGGKRLLVLNCHGGNIEPHKLALDELQRTTELEAYYVHWTDFARDQLEDRFGEDWGHAGEYETSQIEVFRPDSVREDRKEPQTKVNDFESRQYTYFDDLTEEGGLGDPTQSDPEFMETLIADTTERIVDSLRADLPTTS